MKDIQSEKTYLRFRLPVNQVNRDNGDFDWFKKYSDIREHLAPLIPNKDARILMLGCGNSTLSRDMYDDGYHNILNIDVNLAFHVSNFI